MRNYIYPSTLLCDFYKVSHREQYPKGTEIVYSTWIPRASRIKGINEVVAFGFQAFIKEYIVKYFNENFFSRPKLDIVEEYKRVVKFTLGVENPETIHIEQLHDLGYMPIKIKAVKEGTLVPLRVPMLTIENTKPEFFWLTNYLETLMSCSMWIPSTSATIAFQYRKILEQYAKETVGDSGFVPFQGHDFSMRGMGALESAKLSGVGHLLSFVGTDTIPAILFAEEFYNANIENELVGTSIPATEHSVMCAYGRDEFESYKRIITEVYPNGFVSIVSDTWDLWKVLTDVVGKLKPEIMARNGKVVIRPDSGDPVDIICGNIIIEDLTNNEYCNNIESCKRWMMNGLVEQLRDETPHGECGDSEVEGIFKYQDKHYKITIDIDWNRYDKQYYFIDGYRVLSCEEIELTLEQKGVVEVLWDIFGGTITEKGYKLLDSHIGCIYGDAITIERATQICERLKAKGFVSINTVYGIGSFTYQYNTRDTFGFALKSTHVVIDGEEHNIYKDPATDTDKIKKSLTGRVCVLKDENGIHSIDNLSINVQETIFNDLLEDVFVDGELIRDEKFSDIRNRLLSNLK
jgi:nicotinamide phosphoribosyltransferase